MLRGAAFNGAYRSARSQMGSARRAAGAARGRATQAAANEARRKASGYGRYATASGRPHANARGAARGPFVPTSVKRGMQGPAFGGVRGGNFATRQAAAAAKKGGFWKGLMSKKGMKGVMVGAMVAGAGTAAFLSARRTGQDINKSMGNPATAVTSWTTYNRTNRGY